jgi:hypothetical protein
MDSDEEDGTTRAKRQISRSRSYYHSGSSASSGDSDDNEDEGSDGELGSSSSSLDDDDEDHAVLLPPEPHAPGQTIKSFQSELPSSTTSSAPVCIEVRCQGIKERWLDKRDLLKNWILFAVCNWSDPNEPQNRQPRPQQHEQSGQSKASSEVVMKTHFVSLKTIFTEAVIRDFIDYTIFLYDPLRKANKKKLAYLALNRVSPVHHYRRSLSMRQLQGVSSSSFFNGSFAGRVLDTPTNPATLFS